MQPHIAIRHLEQEIKSIPKRIKDTNIGNKDWWNFNKRESLEKQIELYRIGK